MHHIFLIRVLGFLMGHFHRLIVSYPRLIGLPGRLTFDFLLLPLLLWAVWAGRVHTKKQPIRGNGCFLMLWSSSPAGATRLEGASSNEGLEGAGAIHSCQVLPRVHLLSFGGLSPVGAETRTFPFRGLFVPS